MIGAVAAIPGIIQGITGLGQSIVGGIQSSNNNRPKYQVPDAAKQALIMAQSQVADMPGTAIQQQKIDMSSANMVQAAMQSGNPLGALGAIQANQNAAGLNLTAENARHRSDAASKATEALGQYAQYKDMEFQMNQYGPYMDQAHQSENTIGAGMKNMFGGLDSISSIATAALSK